METEFGVQSGCLTGTEPAAVKRPKEGWGNSINTHFPSDSAPSCTAGVLLCALANWT